MTRSQQPALTLFAVGMIGLGILALVYGDFAFVWQPVAPWIPGRTVLAYASGLIMLFGGVGLLLTATAAWSARILFPYLIVWLLLKVPALLVAPQMEAVWLGFGEIAVLVAGGWVLFATLAGGREGYLGGWGSSRALGGQPPQRRLRAGRSRHRFDYAPPLRSRRRPDHSGRKARLSECRCLRREDRKRLLVVAGNRC